MSADEAEIPAETPKFFYEFWNLLPDDLKLEVVKKLDLKSRGNLRLTSSTEKWLVDLTKIHLTSVKIDFDIRNSIDITDFTGSKFVMRTSDYPKALSLISYVFKFGVIDSLEFKERLSEEKRLEMLEELGKHAPLKIKKFRDEGIHENSLKFILEHSEKTLKTIVLNESYKENAPSNEILDIPAIHNAKLIQIVDFTNQEFLNKLVEKWMEKDAEIGTTCQFSAFLVPIGNGILRNFVEKFQCGKFKLVQNYEDTLRRLRFKTGNPLKDMILELKFIGKKIIFFKFQFIASTDKDVIDEDDTWIRDVTPEYDTLESKESMKAMNEINRAILNMNMAEIVAGLGDLFGEDYVPGPEDYEDYFDDFYY